MKKINFKSWGTIGLVVVLSGLFVFQNSNMMRKQSLIELKNETILAHAEDMDDWDPDDLAKALYAIEIGITAGQALIDFIWPEGVVKCGCFKSSTTNPCNSVPRISFRYKCFRGTQQQLSEAGGCNAVNLNQRCKDHYGW